MLPDYHSWREMYHIEVLGNDGWLSLVGLYWLDEGVNTLGSCKGNKHRLPEKAPCHLGKITLRGEKLSLSAETPVMVDGQPQTNVQLKTKPPTLVDFGDYQFFIIEREKGFAVRLKDRNSPYRNQFRALNFYPYDSTMKVVARFEPASEGKKIKIATFYGTVRETKVAGTLHFQLGEQQFQLLAVDYGTEYPMSVMFADLTNQESTYGAGRYLDVPWPTQGTQTLIDFNRAYNPPCAYTNFATCPLPPPQNRLPVAIEAGEKYPPIKK